MQILLVEDDQSLAQGLSQALRPAGYSVNPVATGKAAIFAVQTDRPDIVILDLGLPDSVSADKTVKASLEYEF